jgi:PAS domain S-box-containing protein
MASRPANGPIPRFQIPGRQGLDEKTFRARHHFMLWLLWLHVPFLAAVGLAQGNSLGHVAVESLPVVIPAVFGMRVKNRSLAAMAVSFGLLSCSGILVHYTNGLIESHFHFFVMVTVVALYQDWKPLVLGVGYVALQHGIIGVLSPEQVYNHPAALANPIKWAFIHAAYILFLVVVQLSHWRLAEKADAERAVSEERFRRSFQEAPIGMAMLDGAGRFTQVNKALCDLLGYQAQKLTASNLKNVTHSDDHLKLEEAWETMENGKNHTSRVELRCLTLTGRAVWGKVSLSMLPRSAAHDPIIVLQMEDATQAHADQTRLETLVKGKDEFVASVGHEILEPLESLLAVVAGARSPIENDGHGMNGESTRILSRIEDQAREVISIVEDLVVAASAEANPVSVIPRSIDVEILCQEAIAQVPGARNIPVTTHETTIWADPGRTRQILRSLLGNAIRYGGPIVEIQALTSGPDTLVQVTDNGPEIPSAERERIFRADLRSGRPVTQPATVGLGLTVARTLARQMGGDIIYKRSPEALSVFELRLPSEPLTAPYHTPAVFASESRTPEPQRL